MARTWNEIYNQMVTGTQAISAFNELEPSAENSAKFLQSIKSVSKIAVWRSFIFLIAIYHWLQELRMEDHLAEVNERAEQGEYGTLAWWEYEILKYQHGYQLKVIDGKVTYEEVDEAAKIISVAAARRVGASVEIKIAGGTSPEYAALNYQQKAGVSAFAGRRSPAGENVIIVSQPADLMKLIGEVYFDASAGLSIVTANVESAIDSYLANLKFAGIFKINSLIDKIQEVVGVTDIKFNTVEARTFDGVFVEIERTYESKAGYMKIDPAFTLAANLNYIAS